MCKISNYPGLYSKANEILRGEGINSQMPGYEFLKRAIVIYLVEGEMPKDKFLSEVREGILVPANRDLKLKNKKDREEVEQWMIEAMKSVGIESSLMGYIRQLASETKSS